jgi:hypothetical protein
VLNTDGGGNHLVNVVGGQGIAWNYPRGQFVYSFGYPAAAPYGGERLIYCYDYTFDAAALNPPMLGILCDVTGGSSGGGWRAVRANLARGNERGGGSRARGGAPPPRL